MTDKNWTVSYRVITDDTVTPGHLGAVIGDALADGIAQHEADGDADSANWFILGPAVTED